MDNYDEMIPLLELVESLVSTEAVGALTLKGFQRPIVAYNVTSLRSALPT